MRLFVSAQMLIGSERFCAAIVITYIWLRAWRCMRRADVRTQLMLFCECFIAIFFGTLLIYEPWKGLFFKKKY